MELLSAMRSIADEVYISQQDNAPARHARQTLGCFVVKLWNSVHCYWHLAAQQPGPQSGWLPHLGSAAGTSLPHAITGRGRSTAAVDECSRQTSWPVAKETKCLCAQGGHSEQLLWHCLSPVSWLH